MANGPVGRAKSSAVVYYAGWVTLWLGLVMTIPLLTALTFQEWPDFVNFWAGTALALFVGLAMILLARPAQGELSWMEGFAASALSWVVCMFLAAFPYYLSGHFGSYLDACFDVMSGFTTTGLVLIQDLDHASNALNMWRHLLTFLGGQGMVVLALTLLARSNPGAFKLYAGEAKDQRLLPSVGGTALAIWEISLVYLLLGTLAMFLAGLWIGLPPVPALLHGLWIFMSAWSTGGFAPNSQNIVYYHSLLYEAVAIPIMIAGSMNFGLHYAAWTGNRREILKNIETVVFVTVLVLTFLIGISALPLQGGLVGPLGVFRRVAYTFISAQTTTGLQPVYAPAMAKTWGDTALFGASLAMLFGASASSTAGGFKGIRVGTLFKALSQELKRLLRPERAVVIEKVHFYRDVILDDTIVRSSALIVLLYILTFFGGVILTTALGNPIALSVFEVASATGNTGLSVGITQASEPWTLKVAFILIFFVARMEFISVLVLVGYLLGALKSSIFSFGRP